MDDLGWFSSALIRLGYKVSASHAARGSLKTNAPASVVWDVMRAWVSIISHFSLHWIT
jgi:tRNA G26 N,N-dimethylase Trm1